MSNERLAMKGALKDKEQQFKQAKTLAQGLFDAVRAELKSWIEIEELDMPRIRAFINNLNAQWEKMRQLGEEIKRLKKALYE